MQTMTSVDKLREIIKNSGYSRSKLSISTGINLPWINQFMQGIIKNPGINNVAVLYKFLTGKDLI